MHGSPPKTRRCDSSTTRSPPVAAKSFPAPARLSRREKLLAFARKGNVVVVWKLDRLGRSLRDLIDVVNSLQDRGVGLRSLQEAIDTTTPAGKLPSAVFAGLSGPKAIALASSGSATVAYSSASGQRRPEACGFASTRRQLGSPRKQADDPPQGPCETGDPMTKRNDTLSVEGPVAFVGRSFLHEALPTNNA